MARLRQRIIRILEEHGCTRVVELAALARASIGEVEDIIARLQLNGMAVVHDDRVCLAEARRKPGLFYDRVARSLSQNPYVKSIATIGDDLILARLVNDTLLVVVVAGRDSDPVQLARNVASTARRYAGTRCSGVGELGVWRCKQVVPVVVKGEAGGYKTVEGVAVTGLNGLHAFIADLAHDRLPVFLRRYTVGEF